MQTGNLILTENLSHKDSEVEFMHTLLLTEDQLDTMQTMRCQDQVHFRHAFRSKYRSSSRLQHLPCHNL